MCIGLPMQVISAGPGHALCAGRGETRRVRTVLLGDVAAGEWLLVFLDNAQQRLDACRAGEINATLDLLQQAVGGATFDAAAAHTAFPLPSHWSADELRALAGATPVDTTESHS